MDEIIAQFEKNATEVVRIALTEFRGHKLIDVRVYFSDDEGRYRPTKKGVSLSVELYTDLKRALLALEQAMLERKLITPEELEEASMVDAEDS